MLTIAARKIEAIRKAFGLSMERFGARYGVNKQRVYKWETGKNLIPSRNIVNQMHDDGIVDRHDWYKTDPSAPLLCGTCQRRLNDPVNAGCALSGCPRHMFEHTMEEAA